jgi:hypothetical protein
MELKLIQSLMVEEDGGAGATAAVASSTATTAGGIASLPMPIFGKVARREMTPKRQVHKRKRNLELQQALKLKGIKPVKLNPNGGKE